eukprot:1157324-Pelagomonas_calceolata.AAC.1
MVGNEYTNKVAKYQASLMENNLTDNGIPSAGPGGNIFFYIFAWLAWEEAIPSTPGSSSPISNLMHFPDLKGAFKSHMHAKHRHGYADERHTITNRTILKVVSEGFYGSNLVHMDVGSADHLAQHDLHITEPVI